MNVILLWVLAGIVCLLLGREFARWVRSKNEAEQEKKRDVQALSLKLHSLGADRISAVLDEYAVDGIHALLEGFRALAKLVVAGSDVIEKDLEGVYEKMLDAKMAHPEGMALIKAKIAAIEGPTPAAPATLPAAPVAPPVADAVPAAPPVADVSPAK
jgi:hypothetical protein